MGLDTKTYWLTDRQSQCDFDFDFDLSLDDWERVEGWQFSWALQGRPRRDGAIIQLTRVLHRRLCQEDLSAGSWRISTVRSRCQGTAGYDTTGWKELSGCCGDLYSVKIGGSAETACSYERCVQWSTNPISIPYPVYNHDKMIDEWWIRKNMEWSGRGLIEVLSWRD
jgi:hypothetical protein